MGKRHSESYKAIDMNEKNVFSLSEYLALSEPIFLSLNVFKQN